tara:strand:+ start:7573 stop:9549 length:1977 start_codon:yes stop_codon:yes gene_type:complete
MPYTQLTNLDFDQIKTQIKSYLRANSNFTDFDFEGSNFSVLIDTLAYNTYITAFNSNMVVNESFLDAATVRENVVSLARNIGYVPRSKTAARAEIALSIPVLDDAPFITLEPGLVCVGRSDNTSYTFAISEPVTTASTGYNAATNTPGIAVFGTTESPLTVYQGTFLEKLFVVNTSQDQRFIIDNPDVDTSTIKVYVKGLGDTGTLGREYKKVDNILNLDKDSEIYLLQEVQDEKYELLFGDGFFGKQLDHNAVITVRYIITDGKNSNGASNFVYQGRISDASVTPAIRKTPYDDGGTNKLILNTIRGASNGADIENLSSIKYFAPRLYSSQHRAVTGRDYEAIIQKIFPMTESVSVVGGEELVPPQFGKVLISIKPKNGTYVSDFDKMSIRNELKNYAVAGINAEITDLKLLYVEIDTTVYYDSAKISNSNNLKTDITTALTTYSKNVDINKFGGRFKYSKINQLIDRVDDGITSNITKVKIRRDLKALINQFAQYELCYGNRFHINPEGYNIKSTGFTVHGSDKTLYLTDTPNKNALGNLDDSHMGVLSAVTKDDKGVEKVILKSVGTVDYKKGEIILNTINITSTVATNDLVEIQAFPDSNDVVGLKDLYLSFDASNSEINMIKDVIASGEDISGTVFTRDYYTSSYANGELERK